MLDVKRRNVIRLDTTLTEMAEYGMGGRGYGELQAPFAFALKGDTISVLDFMSRKLKYYSELGYLGEFSLDVMPNDGRMDILKENAFLIPLYSDSSQLSIITHTDVEYIGFPVQFKSRKKQQ